ncbi:MAG: ABC transporter ATP-binding protein [Planctomycetota bacterium]|nr:MAG: ABC transporter ATP-binding protein [Planctomycetota bacterium]
MASLATLGNGVLNQGRSLFAGLVVDKVLSPEADTPPAERQPPVAAPHDATPPPADRSGAKTEPAKRSEPELRTALLDRIPGFAAARDRVRAWLARITPADGDVWGWAVLISVLLGIVAALLGITGWLREYLQAKLVQRVLIDIRVHVMQHLLQLGFRFFHTRRIGDLYSRLTNDINEVNRALNFLFRDLFQASTQLLSGIAICVWASPELSLVSLVLVMPILVVLQVFARKVRKRARSRQHSFGEVTDAMQQMLSGIRIVKAFHAEQHEVERFRRVNESFFRRAVRVVAAKAGARAFTDVLNHAVVAVLILGGVWAFHVAHAIEKQWLVVFLSSLAIMYQPAKKLVGSYNNVMEALAGVERVRELLAVEPEVVDAPDAEPLPTLEGHVRLRHVGFAYDTQPVLRDIHMEVQPGEVVALVGPSGAGKSTLIDLLARLYDPTEGVIEYDGRDIRTVRRADLLAHIAMVTQDPFLFNTTILENLRYGRRDASMEEIVAACKAAFIHDVIASLPGGYEAVVGERGVTLSGGQRQRITIARALLRNPRVLLLDEATSALDSESEQLVQRSLETLMRGRTTFVVAHRLSTIVGADRIYVFSEGRIVEEGTHAALLANPDSLYRRLYLLQTDGEPRPEDDRRLAAPRP